MKKTGRTKRLWILFGFSVVLLGVATMIHYRYGIFPFSNSGRFNSGFYLRHAPSFELKTEQGQSVSADDLKGSVVVLHFWATWCPPCIEELPQWLQFAESFQGKPVKWVAISLDSSWAEAHSILPSGRLPANVISLLDTDNQVPAAFGSYQYPETYLISPDQKIISKWVGPQDWSSDRYRNLIEKVIQISAEAKSRRSESAR